MTLPVEVSGQRLVGGAGGLQAGMRRAGPQLREPRGELGEARGRVGEGGVAELARLADEAGVELRFREVESERQKVCHGLAPGDAAPGQPCACGLSSRRAATRYCPACAARADERRRGLDLTLWLWWPDAGHSLTGASCAARACRFSRLQSTYKSTYNAGR